MRNIVKQYLLIAVSLLVLAVFWEFSLEETIGKFLGFEGEEEPLAEKVEYLTTVMAFGVLALIVPFLWAARADRERTLLEEKQERLVAELRKTLAELKVLKGIIPICSYCGKIRNEVGTWDKMEAYIRAHSEANFSHGVCPECFKKEMEGLERMGFAGPEAKAD